MYGGYVLFNAGLLWMVVWTLIAGFSQNYIMLIVCRALQGVGAAAFLPPSIMMLGKLYRPGPRKNLVFALYGAFAPLGFGIGILIGGISAKFLTWSWYFWLGSIAFATILFASLLAVPNDYHEKRPDDVRMDWLGVATIVPGLILVVYAVTDSSSAPNGWKSPQIITTLIIGVLFLIAAYYVETRVASQPLLPGDLFAPKYLRRMVFALFMSYGAFGLFLFYSSFYFELVVHISPLLTAVWYLPMIIGGLIIATVGGFTLHFIPGKILLLLSGTANLVCALLFALMPADPNYWAWVFPSIICATLGIDITYTVSNIFITSNVPSHRQGLAGALINSLLFLGISCCLGFGDLAVGQTSHLGLRKSYQTAFWLGVGISALATIMYCFINIGSAKSDLTVEERQQLESERSESEMKSRD